MNPLNLTGRAIRNTFRSKARTTLTVVAIFIGAFTLTITNGLGTGINRYIDTTIAAIGADDVMTVTKPAEDAGTDDEGPRVYDPEATTTEGFGPQGGTTVQTMTPDDIAALSSIDGVLSAEPVLQSEVDYVEHDGGTQYAIGVAAAGGVRPDLSAGEPFDESTADPRVVLPESYLAVLGFDDAEDAIGETLTFGLTDARGATATVEATISGVARPSLMAADGAIANTALTDALHTAQSAGLSVAEAERYGSATIRFDPASTAAEVDALTADLVAAGYAGTTVADQLGSFTAVIDGIVLVLNVFAIIALLAAGFGIVNTLLMSVQERTREIGLMKAMGMGNGRVFTLFSLEAVFIGLLGSALGAMIAVAAGAAASPLLSGALLADLPGLTLIAFDPVSIALTVLVVMGIAFVAGTLPAARASRADPIESLRYE